MYKLLVEFNKLIYNKFNVNIHKFPTLPSLAFGIFRTNYLESGTIPKLNGQIYRDISKAYTGGHVDVYKPKGKDLYQVDVNSLYPTVMSAFESPVGPIKYFDGNIFDHDENAFGFFYCNVVTPTNMERPLLQTKVVTEHGLRTLAPLGEWNDWIFSEEIKKYSELGYKFNVLKGYTFGRKIIF